MFFDIISLFPQMFEALKLDGVVGRAINNQKIDLTVWQLRDFAENKYKKVDDRPFGGGAGMVLQVEPLRRAIKHIRGYRPETKVIYLSPGGVALNRVVVKSMLKEPGFIVLCGRYEGIDQRIIDHDVDLELSIGDYVLSGGELAAMVLVDAITRQLPGVLGNEESLNDSKVDHSDHFPQYTRPRVIDGEEVPDVLLSGNDAEIRSWRMNYKKPKK